MSKRSHGATATEAPSPSQMTFEEVVEMELIEGSVEYTEWLAAGKPKVDGVLHDDR